MKSCRTRKGMALVVTIVMTGVSAIILGGVLSYVSNATRLGAIRAGDDVCRLVAQGEIELAKAAINDGFSRSVARGAHIVGTGNTMGTVNSFDWFGVGDNRSLTRTLGARNGLGTAVTLDTETSNAGCAVKVRVGRVYHPKDAQWAEVTLLARATRVNRGGTESSATVMETVRFAQQRSKVFNNAYFVNNYGWFQGSGCIANGDVRANGDMYLDSSCRVNGRVYAARNEELNVKGDVTNYGTMDSYSTYKSTTYGASNMARPLAKDPVSGASVSGGYDAPNSVTTQMKRDRVHANEERETEMPYIGDLTSAESDYRAWAKELHAADPQMCTIKQGGKVIATEYYDGVGPSGDPALADKGVLVLEGTQANPIEINGPVIVKSDVIIKGYVTGQGTIYSGRNIHIVGNIQYKNPPSWSNKQVQNNSTKDMLGLMAKGNIVMGDYTASDWLSSIRTYLTTKPYVQQYKCDSTDDLIGYPETFGGSYVAKEYVPSLENAANAPGGYQNGYFGKVRENVETYTYTTTERQQVNVGTRWNPRYEYRDVEVQKTGTRKTVENAFDRKYYESVCLDSEISSRCSTITRIDAVLYNNHGIFGKLGKCSINGSLVCRNEGLQYSGNLYLNWDIRLYAGSAETVDNNKVGLAKGSDNPPTTVVWRLLPAEFADFN